MSDRCANRSKIMSGTWPTTNFLAKHDSVRHWLDIACSVNDIDPCQVAMLICEQKFAITSSEQKGTKAEELHTVTDKRFLPERTR
jgi:hypothetical protein